MVAFRIDNSLKFAEVVIQEFDKLKLNVSREELQTFVDSNFLPAGHDLEEANLTDWNER